MAKQLLRETKACGSNGRLPVGRTKFRDDYVWHSEDDPFIPGTKIRRIKPVLLGPRSIAFDEAELDRIAAELAALDKAPSTTAKWETGLKITQKKADQTRRRRQEVSNAR